ncbi:biosynthetic-type acetolactate synthase large subunit [Desulfoplanes formicivorans]|uniref:Acetolactate synthase n=1 Tax=Desulfoplanes formicivorans TaxID=1592317 RepID=A0A194AJM6_9BACT|nr:biosynthetic-type acetolactate synthase large subunit [Desulfoplanes formicivorans]GAU09523.1 acetolactate synthase, large subunit, biosynthetic type [Desulfoplanes formicivorans]
MELTGAQVLLESLRREGVEVVFGYPGGATIDIYHELPKYPFRHVLTRHEQGAVHAADGYARASGKVGVCLVTSGPGATNTVTGIATAYMDSIPLVVFTGQVPTSLIGNDAFQEADIVGITRPCVKHNYLVKDIKDLAETIKQAFYLASTGRPGPVLVDLPKDVLQATVEYAYPGEIHMRSYNPHYEPNSRQIQRVVDLMRFSRKPLLFVGGGVIGSNASEDILWMAKKLNIPVIGSLMGLGAFPGNEPLWFGMVGMHGTYAANMAVNNADLLLAVGVRFDDRVTGKLSSFAEKGKIVHIDIDPTSIRKNVSVDVPMVCDCRRALKALRNELGKDTSINWEEKHEEWVTKIRTWEKSQPMTYDTNGSSFIKPQMVIETIYELTKGRAIIATEVGQNQMWAAQFYKYHKPRTLLTSGGLGTMGYGFPAAIGAQLAFPGSLVIDVAGDGSIQMNIQELATAVSYELPVKIVILNNGHLGMVRQWQELFYNRNYCSTCLHKNPDFVALAKAYGAQGYRIEKRDDVAPVLKEAFATKEPTIVDVLVEPEENVYPMVPAGASLTDMLLV